MLPCRVVTSDFKYSEDTGFLMKLLSVVKELLGDKMW